MKVIVRSKNNHGKEIRQRIYELLEDLGIKYTEKIVSNADFAVLIGGDGTMLYDQSKLSCPVLGIKIRGIGYYMKADKHNFEEKIKKILKGKEGKDYFIHKLLRLETRVNGKRLNTLALNEVLVDPIYTRRMFNCELEINKTKNLERNSGILVYTPTGSTALAGSLGAKKLKYDAKQFGVVAIAPYAGKMKKGEILLSEGKVVINCLNKKGEICIDGQEKVYKIKHGDEITVKKSEKYAKIIGFKPTFK